MTDPRLAGPLLLLAFGLFPPAPLLRGGSEDKQAAVEAGASRVEITPQEPLRLGCRPDARGPTGAVEHPLHARCLALRDRDGVLTVILAADLPGIPDGLRQRVAGAVRGRLGIYRPRLAISATGTGGAPVLTGVLDHLPDLAPEERDAVTRYTGGLAGRLVQAIFEALADLAPAELAGGTVPLAPSAAGGAPGAAVARCLQVLRGGGTRALLYQAPLGLSVRPPGPDLIHGDWPGFASSGIESLLPDSVALALSACDADLEPAGGGGLEAARTTGEAVARALVEALEAGAAGRLKRVSAAPEARMTYLELDRERPFHGREALAALLDDTSAGARAYARHFLARPPAELEAPAPGRLLLHAIAFGPDPALLLLSGEVESAWAAEIERRSGPGALWVVSRANAFSTYLPSPARLAAGEVYPETDLYRHLEPAPWKAAAARTVAAALEELSRPGSAASRLKPGPPLSPEEALATFRLDDGLVLELAAREPQVADPVAMAFDEHGRMVVAEMRDYPLGPGNGKAPESRVRLLQDRDGDGLFEDSSVLADRLPYANGVACAAGGVFVTSIPEIVFLRDADGDGRAEVRERVFEGFQEANSQHLANCPTWAMDNWIYVNGGAAAVRSPLKPELPAVRLAGSNFRFDPRTLRLEPATGYRGGFGVTFDDQAEMFVCDNTVHGWHAVLPRRAARRNPHLRVPAALQRLAEHTRVYPASRPLERFNDPFHEGQFSSACGVHVYRGDALPPAYRGSFFVCEPVSNLVHRDLLERHGATFQARRAEEGREFLSSTDHWFRPVNVTTGPDGALYVADMYREVIEHPEWIPQHIQKLFDLRSGMDRGRIYRVRAKGPRPAPPPPLAGAPLERLVAELGHPSGWRRDTAQRLLVERGPAGAVELLEEAARAASSPLARAHALWTLEGLGALGEAVLLGALGDPGAGVRLQAVRIAGERLEGAASGSLPERLVEGFIALAGDPSPPVRFHLALALGTVRDGRTAGALASILVRDACDPWVRTAVLSSLPGDPVPLLEALLAAGAAGREEALREVAALAGRRRRPEEVRRSLRCLLGPRGGGGQARGGGEEHRGGSGDHSGGGSLGATWRIPAVAALLDGLGPGGLRAALETGGGGGAGDVEPRDGLDALFAEVAGRARDESLALEERLEAVRLLGHDGTDATFALLAGFLDPSHPPTVQRGAVEALSLQGHPRLEEALLEAFPAATPGVRAAMAGAFLHSRKRTQALLEAVAAGRLAPRDVPLAQRRSLLESPHAEVRERAAVVFRELRVTADREGVVEAYRQAIATLARSSPSAAAGDAARGEGLFAEHCATCHRHRGRGVVVGPELGSVMNREPLALLVDVLDPNRAIDSRYLGYVVVRRGGGVVTGLLGAETPAGVEIRRAGGESDFVSRREILRLEATSQSVMPEGLEQELGPEALADVLAYVKGRPLRAGELEVEE